MSPDRAVAELIKSHTPVDEQFTIRLPKIELHAHLSGSISPATLHQVWQQRRERGERLDLEDPLLAMSTEKEHFNIRTFFPLFDSYIYRLIDDAWSIRFTTLAVLHSFLNDGVCYLELRTTPRAIPGSSITKEAYVRIVLGSIEEFAVETERAMTVYLILSIDRKQTADEAMETVRLAANLRDTGHPIVAVDLAGNPARGDASLFRGPFAAASAAGLRVTLHFAEIPASSTDSELKTLLSFEPNRLGHVIHVSDRFIDHIISRKIGLELCLSCNVLAGMIEGGIADHHFGDWYARQHPITICTDDVGVFGSPLSREYSLAAKHFKLSREDTVKLARSTYDLIFAGDSEKIRLRATLERFCKLENLKLNS